MTITRELSRGFEENTLVGIADSYTAGGSLSCSTTQKYTGSYSLRFHQSTDIINWALSSSVQKRIGFYNWNGGGYAANARLFTLYNDSTEVCSLRTQANDDLELFVNSTLRDELTITEYNFQTWAHYGMDVYIHSSNGWVNFYIDGILAMSYSGNTGSANINKLTFGGTATHGQYQYIDDLYVDDTTGEGSPAVIPLLRFYPLTLDGNGNYAQWDGSDGNSTDNYQLLDEIPPSDSDYVETNVADEYDSYTLTSITLEAGQTINAVVPQVFATRAGSTEQIALGTRLSSTDSIGSDQTPETSTKLYQERQTTKPGGGDWGESDVNSAELVIKSRGTY